MEQTVIPFKKIEEEELAKKLKEILEKEEAADELMELIYNSHRKVSEFFEKRDKSSFPSFQSLQPQL